MTEENTKQQLHISVRSLVEFIFREGDIDNRHGRALTADAMLEGSRIHRKIQGSMGERYQAEVPLKITIEEELYDLTIDGRADGIFTEAEEEAPEVEIVWVDEIKGMYRNVKKMEEPIYVHQAQAMCYAYIFARDNGLNQMGIQMTYCSLDTEETVYFRTTYSFAELEEWFTGLCNEYRKWAAFQCIWREKRQAAAKQLTFPFAYREGQKKLVGDVYRTILRQKLLFIQAPTGVGKTISTVFPAVKAQGEGLADRIFYLTAKTITAQVAKDTFALLTDHGYRAKVIQLTAKEKLCLCEEMDCNPVHCPYAKGHYDRVNDAVYEILTARDSFTREEILTHAQEHQVCPFEMQLDISSWCDDIICDYNYVFDPNARLKRFFQEGIKGDYLFLIDEAHNLVERSREMYSAELFKEDFLAAKKLMKGRDKAVERLLDKCNRAMLEYKRSCEEYLMLEDISDLQQPLSRLASEMGDFLEDSGDFPGRKDVLEFYLNVRNFMNIYELTDDHYVMYCVHNEEGKFRLKLFCVDPSRNLQKCMDQGKSAILFSATLLPINYYKSLLSTREDNYAVYAETVFRQEQRLLMFGRDVSTRYTRRSQSEFRRMALYIYETLRCRQGNYMIFFPSYKMIGQVFEEFLALAEERAEFEIRGYTTETENYSTEERKTPILRCILQEPGMGEKDREDFLAEFENDTPQTLAAFCVMGGIFGEGIDLKNDKLIGAVIVGNGLPQISVEREILKNYYDERNGSGFDYAFRYPGMNKVLQAAGRVIRTEEDRGVILLLDERFLQPDYQPLFPREWEEREIVRAENVGACVDSFWGRGK